MTKTPKNLFVLEALDSAADWMCEAPEGTDQFERGQELRLARKLVVGLIGATKELHNQLSTLRAEYYRQGITLKNEQVNMISAALLQAEKAISNAQGR